MPKNSYDIEDLEFYEKLIELVEEKCKDDPGLDYTIMRNKQFLSFLKRTQIKNTEELNSIIEELRDVESDCDNIASNITWIKDSLRKIIKGRF